MSKGRLEAFSDGVLAIVITIMVLELKVPHGEEWAALRAVIAPLLTYLLSFVFLGIYWTNHHHMLQATARVNGAMLWANLHLLFWLSLIPVVTAWVGDSHFAPLPTSVYGVVLFLAAFAYQILYATITGHAANATLAAAIGSDTKGRLSRVLYLAAIGLAFVNPWIAMAIYVFVALMWLVPDPRIESRMNQ